MKLRLNFNLTSLLLHSILYFLNIQPNALIPAKRRAGVEIGLKILLSWPHLPCHVRGRPCAHQVPYIPSDCPILAAYRMIY